MSRYKTVLIFLALLVILLPNILWVIVSPYPMMAFKQGFAPALALLIGLIAWLGRRPGLVIALLCPFVLFVPAEAYYVWNFQAPSTVHILGILGETTFREASEYIGQQKLILLSLCSLLIPSGVGWIAWYIGLRASYPKVRAWRWLGLAASLPVISLFAFESSMKLKNSFKEKDFSTLEQDQQQQVELVRDLNLNIYDVLSPVFPFGVPVRLHSYWLERQRVANAKQIVDAIPIDAKNSPMISSQSVVVLVIGESANSLNWGVNGYARDTTPRVAALSDAVSMKNLIAPWSSTRLSVPIILTGQQDPVTGISPLSAPSIMAVFHKAGWKTYWLSNQSPMGQHDSVIALYAGQADVVRYFSGADFTSSASMDDVLLEPMQQALRNDPAPHKLFVLHLLGSHANYHLRFPAQFNRFRPSGMDVEEPGELKALMNSYDNSIAFTDHILGELISSLRKVPATTNASLLYVSDHGQALPTYACPYWGHHQQSEYSYRVPGLLWLSPSAQAIHPGALDQLKGSRNRPLHTNQVFDTLLDLAQIEYSKISPDKSWVSSEWRPAQRTIKNSIDFDLLSFGGECRIADEKAVQR